jgi:hypothetical protein
MSSSGGMWVCLRVLEIVGDLCFHPFRKIG